MADQTSSGTGPPGNGGQLPAEAAGVTGLPLFYGKPQPLDATVHKGWGLREPMSYGFAAGAGAIPLNAVEFALAQRTYPIVFAEQPPHLPVAICGVGGKVNGFVDADNGWEAGSYVPAYVRRFPFILMENTQQKQFILCFDAESGLIVADGPRRLFDDAGAATDLTNQAMDFCRAFHTQHDATRLFVEALAAHDLLVSDTTEMKLPGGRRLEFKGYRVVDRERFDKLPDEVFLEWRRRGWLAPVYNHLLSATNWAGVVQRSARRTAAAAG